MMSVIMESNNCLLYLGIFILILFELENAKTGHVSSKSQITFSLVASSHYLLRRPRGAVVKEA